MATEAKFVARADFSAALKEIQHLRREMNNLRTTTANMGAATAPAQKSFRTFGEAARTDLQMVEKWGMRAVKVIGAIGAAIAGLVIKGGFDRALKIEDAQFRLQGLGHDVESIDAIMDSALKSVLGTAYRLDDAATLAANAVAAGIEPGKELQQYLSTIADTATITGSSMGEIGRIINKMTTDTSVYTMELRQLADRGLPIFVWLQEEIGLTGKEFKKFVEEGNVQADMVLEILEEKIGGAALKSGESTRGAFANMGAAFSRFGAIAANEVLPLAKDAFTGITEGVDRLAKKYGDAVEGMSESEWFAKLEEFVERLPDLIEEWGEAFVDFGKVALPVLKEVTDTVGTFAAVAVSDLGKIAIAGWGVVKAWGAIKAHPVFALVTGIAWVASAIKQHADTIRDEVETLGEGFEDLPKRFRPEAVRNALEDAWGQEAVDRLDQFLEQGGQSFDELASTSEGVAQIIRIAGQDVTDTWNAIAEEVPAASKRVIEWVEAQGPAWEGSGSSAGEYEVKVKEVVDNVEDYSEEAAEFMEGWREANAETFEDMVKSAQDFLTGLEPLPEEADLTMAEFEKNIVDRSTFLAKWFENLTILTANGLTALVEELQEGGPEAMGALAQQYADDLTSAENANAMFVAGEELSYNAINGLMSQEVINDLIQIGYDLVAGIAGGVERAQARGILNAALKNAVGGAANAAKGAAEIQSPSELFAREIGVPIAEGVAEGIRRGIPKVEDALRFEVPDLPSITGSFGLSAPTFDVPDFGSLPPIQLNQEITEMTEEAVTRATRRAIAEAVVEWGR